MGSVPISISRRFTREFPIMNSDDDPQYWPNILGIYISYVCLYPHSSIVKTCENPYALWPYDMTIISNQDIPRNTIHQVHARLRSGKTLGARQATDVKNGVVLEICQNLQFKTFKIAGLSGLRWKTVKTWVRCSGRICRMTSATLEFPSVSSNSSLKQVLGRFATPSGGHDLHKLMNTTLRTSWSIIPYHPVIQ